MTQKDLEEMTRFYLEKLFYNIPYISVAFAKNIEDGTFGSFR